MSAEEDELEGRTIEENVSFLNRRIEELEQNNRSNNQQNSPLRWCFIKHWFPIICSRKVSDVRWALFIFGLKYNLQLELPLFLFRICFGIEEIGENDVGKDKDSTTEIYKSLYLVIYIFLGIIVFPSIIVDMWDNYIKPFIKRDLSL